MKQFRLLKMGSVGCTGDDLKCCIGQVFPKGFNLGPTIRTVLISPNEQGGHIHAFQSWSSVPNRHRIKCGTRCCAARLLSAVRPQHWQSLRFCRPRLCRVRSVWLVPGDRIATLGMKTDLARFITVKPSYGAIPLVETLFLLVIALTFVMWIGI